MAAPFIHDITISDAASMNVVADSAGWNLNLDHHRTAPSLNLFTNLNMGVGTRPFASGGRSDRGAHSGRGNVYWGLHTKSGRPMGLPDCGFGPMLNFVGPFVGAEVRGHARLLCCAVPAGDCSCAASKLRVRRWVPL